MTSPIAPSAFHCSSVPTLVSSLTVTRRRVIHASTSTMLARPPRRLITLTACEAAATLPEVSDASASPSACS